MFDKKVSLYCNLQVLSKEPCNFNLIKKYLLVCCKRYIRYRSSGNLEEGIKVASKYMRGEAAWKQLHSVEWQLEGEAFCIEYYNEGVPYFVHKPNHGMQVDLKKIRICEGFNQREAACFLEDLAYFIVYVFSYVYRAGNDLPPQKYDRFLCPMLFDYYFGSSS